MKHEKHEKIAVKLLTILPGVLHFAGPGGLALLRRVEEVGVVLHAEAEAEHLRQGMKRDLEAPDYGSECTETRKAEQLQL